MSSRTSVATAAGAAAIAAAAGAAAIAAAELVLKLTLIVGC
jgi:hypothetical protein